MTTCHPGALRASRPNRGQALVLLSLFLVTLIALVGLGVDGGILYLNHRAMQNAADAGAFAGARLPAKSVTDTPTIRAEIEKLAGRNYVANPASAVTAYYTDDSGNHVGTITSAAGTKPAGATGVEVIATRQTQTLFLPIIGYGSLRASAIAAAHGRPTTGGGPGYLAFSLKTDTGGADGLILDGSGMILNGPVHSNSDITFGGGGNTLNGSAQYKTGYSPTNYSGKWTINDSSNNNLPVQSTVLPDPVNKTTNDFYQGTTNTSSYFYFPSGITSSTQLANQGLFTNGVLTSGTYYVNGDITLGGVMSVTQASTVTLVATGNIKITQTGIFLGPFSNVVGHGSMVGYTIKTTGSSDSFSYDSSFFPQPTPAEITLYK